MKKIIEIAKESVATYSMVGNEEGDPTPSMEDIHVTRRLAESGKMLGILVLDHLIIGNGRYTSLKEKGHI